jgi:cytochrome c2
MIKPLSHLISAVFIFLFGVTLITFGTVYLIANQNTSSTVIENVPITPITPAIALTETAEKGKALFKTNCASCHKLYKKAVGPALHNVVNKYDTEWLYSWIKNSAALIKSGDAQAIAIYEEYNQSNMNSFPQLTNEDIDNILEYTSVPKP